VYDAAIIGCGVIGALTARELARYKLNICVLEARSDAAMGASGANSGIAHAGFDAPEGSLKALYNARGNKMMPGVCRELGVTYRNNGSLVLAFSAEELQVLNKLSRRGRANGVRDLEVIDQARLRGLEPNASDAAVGALWAKTGGIVSPYSLTIAAIGNAMDNGAELKTDFETAAIERGKKGFNVISSRGDRIQSELVVNCAGIYADKVAGMIGDISFKIGARKGEYILLDRESGGHVTRTLFTCPNAAGKGVLVSPTADGNLLIGPTSLMITDKTDNSTSREGLEQAMEKARRLCKNIPFYNTITSFCGIRAYSDRHDFVVEPSRIDRRFFNVAGIESPGLTSAPAIAEYTAKAVVGEIGAKTNPDFNGTRKSAHCFKDLSIEEKNEIIRQHPAYGEIVCRCEAVTLGEILFELERHPVPKTPDGLKRRLRVGMGRCQGGFCQPSVVDVLCKRFNISYEQITKCGGGSHLFTGKTK